MFMTKKKARGRFYYYLYVYDRFNERGMRPVCSLGSSPKALQNLEEWKEQNDIPPDLLALGLKKEQLKKWHDTIKMNLHKEKLESFTYKEYNKKRKRQAAPTEAHS